ncbi:MAG: DUF47 family protein [Syntrophomonadaceae bacterium]|nr:DUF47 family protein [Syntrophomonadaceae bacterium]
MALFGNKDENLFFLFSESARVVLNGGDILNDVVENYENLDSKMAAMTTLENEGDRIIETLVRKLHTSFILPFDREDALQLVQKLANTLDYITGIIDIMCLVKEGKPNIRIKLMIDVLYEALVLQKKAIELLPKLEKNRTMMLQYCEQIRQLEHKQDKYYRQGLGDLFENEKNAVRILKWRGVYEHIEMAQDHIEDVAILLRNIAIKYS